MTGLRLFLTLAILLSACGVCRSEWKPHIVRQRNGSSTEFHLSASHQIVTGSRPQRVVTPYVVYVPEKKRLVMLVGSGDPDLMAMTLFSDDLGGSWSEPKPLHESNGMNDAPLTLALTYLGDGNLIANEEGARRWSSVDYGVTWTHEGMERVPTGMAVWDPAMVVGAESSNETPVRLVQSGYRNSVDEDGDASTQAYLMESVDLGRTWNKPRLIPQWAGVNEVSLVRASNGNWIAGCRTYWHKRFAHLHFDHWCGLAVSISKDDGKTWSGLNHLYEWGRHHPSMVVFANGNVVMTYVVRLGYSKTPDGKPRFGVEAVVSQDHGVSWDLDHRYLLDVWEGESANSASQATSSVLLPNGKILTAYGTGFRARKSEYAPRDIGLVLWEPGNEQLNDDRSIRDSALGSDVRNRFDPGDSN